MSSSQSSATGQGLREADKHVGDAQEAVLRLSSRASDARALQPKAEATQCAFRRAEKDRFKLEAALSSALEYCKLDCNYLPASAEDTTGVPDSLRSETRIPWVLRRSLEGDVFSWTLDELIEAGLTSKCITCFGPAFKPKSGKLPVCERCDRIRNKLTAACEICSAPIRASTEGEASNLCERCSFACFRCTKPIFIARDASTVTCDSCRLTWKAGVLGYELVTHPTSQHRTAKAWHRLTRPGRNALESSEKLGDGEIEYYASRWQTIH